MRFRIGALIRVAVVLLLAVNVGWAQETIGPETYPDGVNPLTGLPVENPEVLRRPPLIVKIDNYPPDIRPQSGLSAADMVWETLLAGGATRFGAIFLANDVSHVGPIRSCRLVDFELSHVYHSLFTCSGMAQGTLDWLRADTAATERSIVRGGPCPPLCRFPREEVAFEHTLYGDTAGLRELAAELGRNTTAEPLYGMAFSATATNAGTAINGLRVEYTTTTVEWTYNEGRWLRVQDGAPHLDALTGKQIGAANVLILEANHIEQPVVTDGYWGPPNYAFDVELIGRGRVILLRDGQYIEGEWRREGEGAPLTYYDRDGNGLTFKPGNTFVNLMPRWVYGYQLVFDLAQPLTVEINYSGGVYLRQGPGTGFTAVGVAQFGETFNAVGRNRVGDWLELLLPNGAAVWASTTILNITGDVMTLPLVRPTIE